MKIYVASSWRNPYQADVVQTLRKQGHEVYDFKNPESGDHGFHWSEIDKEWKSWNLRKYISGLKHPLARNGFDKDYKAMLWADLCFLTLPCGRSAHAEAGWFSGSGKPVIVYIPPYEDIEPELMYKMFYAITDKIKVVE